MSAQVSALTLSRFQGCLSPLAGEHPWILTRISPGHGARHGSARLSSLIKSCSSSCAFGLSAGLPDLGELGAGFPVQLVSACSPEQFSPCGCFLQDSCTFLSLHSPVDLKALRCVSSVFPVLSSVFSDTPYPPRFRGRFVVDLFHAVCG